ncbi:hypothetical protein BX265_6213 [Streptomyces sp. TLI_235]|nr:hypothetical protein [Streptomyces sp. TLI_235]PBC71603.1 hypothetical protein BX265_6213 [Streptomyces sp. TLI_235]
MANTRLAHAALAAAIAITATSCTSTTQQPPPTAAEATSTPSPSTSTADAPATSIQQWYNGGGKRLMDDVYTSLTAVSLDIGTGNTSDLKKACADLSTNVRAMRLYGAPMPDATADVALKSALEHLQMAGLKCTMAVQFNDQGALDEMSTELVAGTRDVEALIGRIKQLQ